MNITFKLEGECVVEGAARSETPEYVKKVLESLLWEYSGIKATLRISEYKEEQDADNT